MEQRYIMYDWRDGKWHEAIRPSEDGRIAGVGPVVEKLPTDIVLPGMDKPEDEQEV